MFGTTFEIYNTEETVLLKLKEMKKLICTSILAILIASVTTVRAQDYPEEYLGLPGDNLNLYAVMKVFQESETLEAFERNLNAEDSRINNLDLNGDNMVDYLTVADYVDGNVHTIVLRSVLDRNEYQDVAVFTIEKLRDGSVQIQLIGDQALYGRNYIVEPIYAETPNPGYRGNQVQRNNVTVVTTSYYEVAAWPMISYIYSPRYVTWRSSWYWGYYPVYWSPWRPFYWHQYYGYHYNWYPDYYAHYRHWDYPRYQRYNTFYYGSVRAHSASVERRITEGNYRQTYSRPESRRDGEALYSSTHGTRSSSARQAPAAGSDRRDAAATGSRSSSQSAVQNSEGRRTSTNGQSRSAAGSAATSESRGTTRTSTSQSGETTRRSTSGTVSSTPATTGRTQSSAGRSQSTVSRSQPPADRTQSSASRTQSTVQRSQPAADRTQSAASRSESSAGRSQSTVQRSQPSAGRTQSSASRSQSTVRRSQPPAGRSQSSVQKSSPSVSQKSAPAARSQSRSSSQGRSSSAPSSSSSKSSSSKSSTSKSSKSSENNSRSSRR